MSAPDGDKPGASRIPEADWLSIRMKGLITLSLLLAVTETVGILLVTTDAGERMFPPENMPFLRKDLFGPYLILVAGLLGSYTTVQLASMSGLNRTRVTVLGLTVILLPF
jgi:hypothetical protein